MNLFERQAQLSQSMFDINSSTIKSLVEHGQSQIKKYVETNQQFGNKLPEVRDLSTLISLQREYSEAIVSNIRSSVEEQTTTMKDAFSQSRKALEAAFATETA